MGVQVDPDVLEYASERFRAAGVRRVEYDGDGTVRALEFYPDAARRSTIPGPPPPSTLRDPHPDLFSPDEPVSDKIARELGLLDERGWPE